MKIVSMVPNSGARDVRVIKEARTLVDAGHSVDVIGIREPDHTSLAAIVQENLIVHRIHWQAAAFQRTTIILLLLSFIFFTVGAFVVFYLGQFMFRLLAGLGLGEYLAGSLSSATEYIRTQWLSSGLISKVIQGRFAEIELFGGIVLIIGSGVFLAIMLVFFWILWRYVRPIVSSFVRKTLSFMNFFFAPAKNFSSFALDFADLERIHLGSSKLLFEMVSTEGIRPFIIDQIRHLGALIHFHSVHTLQTKRMIELALELKPDLIYCHEVGTLKAGVAIKKKLGIPLIYDAHEMYDALVQAPPHILERYKKLHAKYLPEADAFVTVNETIAQIYHDEYPFIKETVIVKNATPLAKLKPYDGRLHEAAKLPFGRKILLYQGGFSPSRGIESIVKAGRYLPDDWSVVLMGWGRLQEDLEALIAEQAEEWTALTIENLVNELKRKSRDKITSEARDILLSLTPAGDTAELEKNITAIYKNALTDNDVIDAGDVNTTTGLQSGARAEWTERSLESQLGYDATDDESGLVDSMKVRNRLVQRYINKAIKTLAQWDKAGKNLRSDIEIGVLKKILLENIPKLDPINYDKVRMIPPAVQEQLPLWSQGATLGAIPYPNDGLNHWACSPNKLWEYPNAGVPILVSPVPELYKAATQDGIGWVLPPDPSAQQIAMIIQDLTDEQFAQAKANCKKYIERDNWTIYAKRLVDLVERIGTNAAVQA